MIRCARHAAYLGAFVVVALLGMLAACNLQRCSEGAVCQASNSSGPSAVPSPTVSLTPTPTPTPSPSPVAESCDFDTLTLRPVGGLTVAIGEKDAKLSLTPYLTLVCKAADGRVECAGKAEGAKVLHEVAEACNLKITRLGTLIWSNSAPDAVSVGTGYEPLVTRKKAGDAVVQATLEGEVSNAVVVR